MWLGVYVDLDIAPKQWRRQIIGGGDIHIFVFTDHKNNLFQKKLIMQNTIYEY